MYDIEKVALTFADCSHLSDDCFCLVFCPVDWKKGDDRLLLYAGETRAICIYQAILDHVISVKILKCLLLSNGWAAVGRAYVFDEEELDNLRAQFSPWEFVSIYDALEGMTAYQIERALTKASFDEYCALWPVGALRYFLEEKAS